MSITIDIVDDHILIREGLIQLLEQHPGIRVWHTYGSGHELLCGLESAQPDVLLLDIQLPDMPGNELVRKLHKLYPELKIIALSSLDTLFHIKDMMQHGCKGYVTKQAPREVLPEAIRRVHAGETYMEPGVKERWMESLLQSDRQRAQQNPLSIREEEILKLIAQELTAQQIADKLFISQRTVNSHRYSLLKKLDVKNTAGLIKVAVQRGLIE